MPCPNDVNIPENLRYMNYHRVYRLEEYARQAYAKLGTQGHHVRGLKADACIQCGECEPKCPQNIPIVERLEEVAAVLGSDGD
jgi:predicted aldo/keto reductase-like oxidoreductase